MGRLSKWRAQVTVNHPSETVMVQLHLSPPDVDGSSNGRASDCDSDGCEFDSHPSTQKNANICIKDLTFTPKSCYNGPVTMRKGQYE